MILKHYWKAISLSLSALCIAVLLAYSCADFDPCDTYGSFFTPNSITEKNYDPFYYMPYGLFYQCDVDSANQQFHSLESRNGMEWQQFVGKAVQTKDIETVLYRTPDTMLHKFYHHLEKNTDFQIPDSLRSNTFLRWFEQGKDLEALGYILFAKQCEVFATAPADAWEEQPIDINACNRLIRNGLQLFRAAKQSFFQQRYSFQIIRLAFYQNNFERCIQLHDSLMPAYITLSPSINERALSFKAGALAASHREAEGAYLFSRLFEQSDDYANRVSQYLSYSWTMNEDRMDEVLAFCKNNHEKAVLYAMQGFRHPEVYHLTAIKKVYELDPQNSMLDVLMVREVNKAESAFAEFKSSIPDYVRYYQNHFGWMDVEVTPQMIDEVISKQDVNRQKLMRPCTLITQIASQGRIRNRALWYAAAAHLHFLNDDYRMTDSLLDLASRQKPNQKANDQIRIIRLANQISSAKRLDAKTENVILPSLIWLETLAKQQRIYRSAYSGITNTLLPMKYLPQGDTLKAFLSYSKFESLNPEESFYTQTPLTFSEMYWSTAGQFMDTCLHPEQVMTLQRLVKKPEGKFQQWLCAGILYNENMLAEIMAVKFMQQHRFAEARNVLESTETQIKVCNPFVTHVRDFQDNYKEEDTLQSYSLRALADTLYHLQRLSDHNPEAAFHLASAIYSLSYFGKCWNACTYYRSYDRPDYYMMNENIDNAAYNELKRADQLFRQVLSTSTDSRLKERSLWMLAKIWQKRYPGTLPDSLQRYRQPQWDDYAIWASQANPYFSRFVSEASRPYYEEVYRECSYLRAFTSH
jgi:hypothetical protein